MIRFPPALGCQHRIVGTTVLTGRVWSYCKKFSSDWQMQPTDLSNVIFIFFPRKLPHQTCQNVSQFFKNTPRQSWPSISAVLVGKEVSLLKLEPAED